MAANIRTTTRQLPVITGFRFHALLCLLMILWLKGSIASAHKSVQSTTLLKENIETELSQSKRKELYGDFQKIKPNPTAQHTYFLLLGKTKATKIGKINKPAKSESFPVRKLE